MNEGDRQWFAMMVEHMVNSLASIENSLSVLVDHCVGEEEDEE